MNTTPSVPLKRNLARERAIVLKAVRGLLDCKRLLRDMHTRASSLSGEYVKDPYLIKRGMDRPQEACEEAADGINHLLYHMQEFPHDSRNHDYEIAIRFFALAYERIRGAAE